MTQFRNIEELKAYLNSLGHVSWRINPITSSVLTTATQLLTHDQNRLAWVIINLSGNDGYIGFDKEVSSTRGIPAASNGGFVNISALEDGSLAQSAVFGISNNATSTWLVMEGRTS